MPAIINSDDGVVSGTAGLKTAGGNDGLLDLQSNGTRIAGITTSAFQVGTDNISAVNSMGFRNRIINGDMRIDQRNAGGSVTPDIVNNVYPVDRWFVAATVTSKYTAQRNAGSVTPPAGFSNYLGITSSSAYSVLTGDTFYLGQVIEGFNIADFGWGAAGAAAVTLSFWVRSSLTGTFGGSLTNAAGRSYLFSYTISAANTWEQKTVTVPGDTTGTWGSTNSIGVYVWFGLGSGSVYSGTSGVWSSSTLVQPTGTVSVVGTNGATFYITGVQLEAGSVATPFERRDYGRELMLCQRYFYKTYNTDIAVGTSATSGLVFLETLNDGTLNRLKSFNSRLPVTMRATPTVSVYSQTGTIDRINVYSNSASTLTVSSVANAGTGSFLSYLQTSTNAVAAQTYTCHMTASAEI